MSDVEAIATKVIELIPQIVEKKPDLAFKLFELLKKYFVPIELFQEYLKKLDRIEQKVDDLKQEVAGLKEDVSGLKQEMAGLKREVAGLKEDVSGLKQEIRDIKVTLDRVMLSLEEESRSVLMWWLRRKGIGLELDRAVMCGMEIDLFGVSDDLVFIGDATVRAGRGIVQWIYSRAKKLLRCRPEFKERRFIISVYAMYFSPDAVELAKKLNVWLVSDGKEVTTLVPIQGTQLD